MFLFKTIDILLKYFHRTSKSRDKQDELSQGNEEKITFFLEISLQMTMHIVWITNIRINVYRLVLFIVIEILLIFEKSYKAFSSIIDIISFFVIFVVIHQWIKVLKVAHVCKI